ncbi:unnamed protein product [Lupinus luteus]|uniref:Uncharacterized protein n=1 Tax=Lupinus luteus TaxID=3873 RepID=A0AAV1WBM5_LUPLU
MCALPYHLMQHKGKFQSWFHFKGGDLVLPAENYTIADSNLGVVCLAMGASSAILLQPRAVHDQDYVINVTTLRWWSLCIVSTAGPRKGVKQ